MAVDSRRGENSRTLTNELGPWGLRAPRGASDGTATLGRVVRVDRGECDVVTEAGIVRVLSDSIRAQDETAPVTGDWVEIEEQEGLGAVIGAILERTTSVSRRDPAQRDIEQVLAANVELVGVVHGLDRPLPAGRLERLLVVAINSGASPLVILTKADTAAAGDQREADECEAIVRSVCRDIPVVKTSIIDGSGLDELVGHLGAGRTLALIGASGVGKSALVNALAKEERLEVGSVRDVDSKGRHTTTARELVLLPGDAGLVLDTPGIRSVGLWEAEHALDLVFGDLEELSAGCRFDDCVHSSEPGCAITAAVADGTLDGKRVERYVALVAELADQRQRELQRSYRPRR